MFKKQTKKLDLIDAIMLIFHLFKILKRKKKHIDVWKIVQTSIYR